MKRFYGLADGQVQGVGFRSYMQLIAIQHHCTGWVKNLENGTVEFQLQGEKEDLLLILSLLQKGNQFIKVNDLQTKEIDLISEKKFLVR
ncbi:MAG: acylphosphatase [Anaerorhabdus sp.]